MLLSSSFPLWAKKASELAVSHVFRCVPCLKQLQGRSGKPWPTHATQQLKLRNSLFDLRMENSYNMLHLLNKNNPRQTANQKERPEWATKLMVHRLTDIPGCEPVAMCGIFSVHSWILRSFSLCVSMLHVYPCLWGCTFICRAREQPWVLLLAFFVGGGVCLFVLNRIFY